MKKTLSWMFAAIFICGTMASCGGKNDKQQAEEPVVEQAVAPANVLPVYTYPYEGSVEEGVSRYLIDSLGAFYSPGEVCIPLANVIKMDESDDTDVKVMGDFWVFNYNLAGDTLKMVSGGSHPGLLHLAKTAEGYAVTAFEQVADGSEFIPTAKKIFGDMYESFTKVNGDSERRNQNLVKVLAEYVQRNQLPVTCYQDYGWPAVMLFPEQEAVESAPAE